jgi:hypothetical protein
MRHPVAKRRHSAPEGGEEEAEKGHHSSRGGPSGAGGEAPSLGEGPLPKGGATPRGHAHAREAGTHKRLAPRGGAFGAPSSWRIAQGP